MSGSASRSSPVVIDGHVRIQNEHITGTITQEIYNAPGFMDAITKLFNDLTTQVLPTVHNFPVPEAAKTAQGDLDMTLAIIEAKLILKNSFFPDEVADLTCASYLSIDMCNGRQLPYQAPALNVDCRSEEYKSSLPSGEAVRNFISALPRSVLENSPRLRLKALAYFFDRSTVGVYELEFPLAPATGKAHDPIVIED